MARGKSYSDILSAALDDMIEHGYDSAERLAYWQRKIREAAEASLASPRRMEEMLRDVLKATYERMLKSGRIAEYHRGISRFTLQKVDPLLRDELTRRIMASADLIKLNRTKAVEQTLQRFAGWGSSIPAGGTKQADKRAEKAKLRKPLARLRFEERRVLTDQGHKLVASINDVVATGGGAIAAKWRSKWRQPGYDFRPDHKERDEVFYGIRGSWAFEQGLLRKPATGWTDEQTQPAEEPFCGCKYVYVYAIRDVPEDWLTAKGREKLAEVRRKIAEMA